MKDFLPLAAGALVRAALQAAAGAGIAVGEDWETKLVGAVVVIVTIAWSFWQKKSAK